MPREVTMMALMAMMITVMMKMMTTLVLMMSMKVMVIYLESIREESPGTERAR